MKNTTGQYQPPPHLREHYAELRAKREAEKQRVTPEKSLLPEPGDILALGIKLITGESASSSCRCNERRRAMNRWGWWGCWKRKKLIALWLQDEAKRRGHECDNPHALIRAAFKELTHGRKLV